MARKPRSARDDSSRAPAPPVALALGPHHRSPVKKRNIKRTKSIVEIPGARDRVLALQRQMEAYRRGETSDAASVEAEDAEMESDNYMGDAEDDQQLPNPIIPVDHNMTRSAPIPRPALFIPSPSKNSKEAKKARKLEREQQKVKCLSSQARQNQNWLDILPGLDQPYLEYLNASIGVPPELSSSLRLKCTRARCESTQASVLCLYLERTLNVQSILMLG
ncbi:hypothetical protein C8J56DRAFT_1044864 [Mycena floridula]|nr:hypothetical protein C8J56DRAFT_1044864 [Mycena floridula]